MVMVFKIYRHYHKLIYHVAGPTFALLLMKAILLVTSFSGPHSKLISFSSLVVSRQEAEIRNTMTDAPMHSTEMCGVENQALATSDGECQQVLKPKCWQVVLASA